MSKIKLSERRQSARARRVRAANRPARRAGGRFAAGGAPVPAASRRPASPKRHCAHRGMHLE
ncbi:hypothetical protein BURPS305_0851 [Burkholderia pseudomallei 305]|nr:hypothetical protein BURPS305_0851 [Burkholderia pseudomallei 305]